MSRPKTPVMAVAATLLVLLAAALGGCREEPPLADSAPAIRIVSLSPALTRMVVDLDPGLEIVGRTRYCLSVDQSIPVVGDLIDLDYEQIVRIDPTHVLVQPSGGRVDQRLQALADKRGWRLAAWRINSIEDIRRVVQALPAVIHDDEAERAALDTRAAALLAELDEGLVPDETGSFRGRVLLLHGVDPVQVFGDGTYLAEVLVRLGAVNASPASGWVELTLEDVVVLDPAAIVLLRQTPEDPTEAIGPLARLDIAAVRDGRIAVLAATDALLPSTALIPVAAKLRVILRSFDEAEP